MDDQSKVNSHQANQDVHDDRRFQRLADYQKRAVKNADPLVASLAVINSDLMGFAFRLSKAIDGAVGEGAASLQELHQVDPALNSYLRVAKQIDRFTQLGIHLGRPERSAVAATISPTTKKRTSSQAKKARLDTHSPAPVKAARRRK